MTLKHSPGPWTHDGIFVLGADGRYVCWGVGPQDGRVIKAAPDMLLLLRVLADIPLEQARLGIGPRAAIKQARKMLQELDGDTCHGN